jgi:drug/metabolite transporter (DMT)-like permease
VSDAPLVALTISAGLLFALLILLLARRGRLSMRYTLGWLFVAGCIMVAGLASGFVGPIADFLGISAAALVFATATTALLALTVQLSITVSGLIEHTRTLAESVALLGERVRRIDDNPNVAPDPRRRADETPDRPSGG